jgi:feruloyl esterase
MRFVLLLTMIMVPGGALAQQATQPPSACQRLATLSLPNTTITVAQVVTAGAFTVPANPSARGGGGSSALAVTLGPVPDVPGRVTANTAGLGLGYNGGRGIPPFSSLPAFCRVVATLTPSAASEIHVEMWMPASGWNGHFRGARPNGLGGVINYNAMGVGLNDGFAVVSTDTTSGRRHCVDADSGQGQRLRRPRHARDDRCRKALTAAYYGSAPKYSYMIECGGGSAAALHEVQKYPADYNGIVVGGHAAHLTRQIFGQVWLWMAAHPNGVAILPTAKLSVIHEAVLAKCDLLDGVKDGLLEDPTRCTFDPKEIECRSADGPNCLTTAQVDAARKIYAGPANPRTNERIWSPLYRGSELD